MTIREMTIEDYEDIIELFKATPGITVREADSKEATRRYLKQNTGLSFVATDKNSVIGCVMSGHDGRRGYMQHLVVKPKYRGQGIGKALVRASIESLKNAGIAKTHIFVFKSNDPANSFWKKNGWSPRDDINIYSYNVSSNENC